MRVWHTRDLPRTTEASCCHQIHCCQRSINVFALVASPIRPTAHVLCADRPPGRLGRQARDLSDWAWAPVSSWSHASAGSGSDQPTRLTGWVCLYCDGGAWVVHVSGTPVGTRRSTDPGCPGVTAS